MSPTRHRPAGFDARPERPSSLRAQAQRVFRAAAERDDVLNLPQAREEAEQPTALTRNVRALYEDSAVPVREIARLAGVSERTLYKYVAKGGWRRRHDVKGVARLRTAKGAGGRFIRSEDAGQPIRSGLKALDPGGEARALVACRRAAALSDDALARTRALRVALSDARIMALLVQTLHDIAAIEDTGRPAAPAGPGRDLDELRRELLRRIEAAMPDWEADKRRRAASEAAAADAER